MWLSRQELEELTQRKRWSAQIRVLIEAGIPFQVVAGRPIVIKEDLHQVRDRRRHGARP